MNISLNRRCSTRRRWPVMWVSLIWIWLAWLKLASCLWVDWVAMMPGLLRPQPLQSHGETAAIDRMEFHEAGPGLIEQDIVAQLAELLDDRLGAVDRAVVAALLDHRRAERPRPPPGFGIGDQRMRRGSFPGSLFVQRLVVDRADQSVRVTVGFQKDGNAAAEIQRAVMRGLVVVAVEQHQVVLRHQRLQTILFDDDVPFSTK